MNRHSAVEGLVFWGYTLRRDLLHVVLLLRYM